jgi:hypothetical protein
MEIIISGLQQSKKLNLCILPKDIFSKLGLSTKNMYKFHVGQNIKDCIVQPYDSTSDKAFFSEEIITQLLLPKDVAINIWKKDDDIFLGPVVGIFINSASLSAIQKDKDVISELKHIEASFKSHCIAYIFSVNSVNWNKKKILGYTFNLSNNKWVRSWFPLPNVMYDRAAYYTAKEIPLADYIFYQLIYIYNIPYINTYNLLPKWTTHVKLSKHPEMNDYLPMTIHYYHFNDVMFMLNKFNFIFLKASIGCRGKEVLSIKKVGNKYKLNYYWEGLREVLLDDVETLRKYVRCFVRKRTVIIQQGINLLKYHERSMDLRIILVKDGNGNWQGTNVRSRIADGGQTITNHAAGGDIFNYEEIYHDLKNSYSGANVPSKEDLIDTAKFILSYIENEFGRLGEIGMDLAIDDKYKIWFIEGNPKLDKFPHEGLDDMASIWPPALSVFEYAKFLVGMK